MNPTINDSPANSRPRPVEDDHQPDTPEKGID